MNYASDVMCAASPNDLNGISDRLAALFERFSSICSNLTDNADRTFGSNPLSVGGSTATKLESIPSGMIGTVTVQISSLERIAGDLVDAAARFNRL